MSAVQTFVMVTARHISNGVVQDCGKCPVALAIFDAVGDPAAMVEVDRLVADVHLPGEWRQADLPATATSFIDDYDNLEGTAAPFSFMLTWRVMEDPEVLS